MRSIVLALFLVTTAFASNDKSLRGSWKLVEAVVRGIEVPPAQLEGVVRTFDDQEYVIAAPRSVVRRRAHYSTDESATPKIMVWKDDDGPLAGKTLNSIYEIKGQMLRICTSLDGSKSPESFDAPSGSLRSLDVYRRLEEEPNKSAVPTAPSGRGSP